MENVKNTGDFLGMLVSFNNSLKLYHWHVSGDGSYAQHMALDQALVTLGPALDSLVETTYALEGDIQIVVPQTKTPTDIVRHAEDFYQYIDDHRKLFKEDFSGSLLDDCQQSIQQMLYRLKRLA